MSSWYDFDEFIRPPHLSGPTTMTISRWGVKEIYNPQKRKKESKSVIWFREWERDQFFFLNATNRGVLCEAFGDDPENAMNKRVTLMRETMPNGKETITLTIAGDAALIHAGSGNKKSDAPTQFWKYVGEHKIDREHAKQAVAEANNDFVAALSVLVGEQNGGQDG